MVLITEEVTTMQLRRDKGEHSVDFLTRAAARAVAAGYIDTPEGPLCASCAPYGDLATSVRVVEVHVQGLCCYLCPAGAEPVASVAEARA